VSGSNEGERAEPGEGILLVNDDVILRVSVAQYLRECGYRVIEAANANEALTVLRNPEIALHVVFSDLHMPGTMGGFELAQWVRTNRPQLDVILAGTTERVAKEAAEICDDGPLSRPYHPQTLVERIKKMKAARDHQR
jgi:CheY-like chemotaxis protein